VLEELTACPLFAGLTPEFLAELVHHVTSLGVPGGREVFHEGDEGDGLYVVLHGRLRSKTSDGRSLGDITSGGYVGEMALLTGARRSATVFAVRDSTLARLDPEGFQQLILGSPQTALLIAHTVAARAQSNIVRSVQTDPFSTVCVLAHRGDADAEAFEEALVQGLRRLGPTADITSESRPHDDPTLINFRLPEAGAPQKPTSMNAVDAAWFDSVEKSSRFIVYRCRTDSRRWTDLCRRRADLILFVAHPGDVESMLQVSASKPSETLAGTDVVLLHGSAVARDCTASFRQNRTVRSIHHVRAANAGDADRIVRLLTGRGTGLALSGGGRRGAAHVGTLRALQEARIGIDVVAGTSAGGIVGAMAALEMDWREALEHVRLLARMPAWRDAGPPMVSLLSGRSFSRTLKKIFGETRLEETCLPFLPVCSAVETGEAYVPDSGPLWLALRASASLPGIFPPVPWNARVLMDGALVNNLPVDLLRARCPFGRMIASDVGLPVLRTDLPSELHSMSGWSLLATRWLRGSPAVSHPTLVDLLTGAACAASTRHFSAVRVGIDCYIAPQVGDAALLSRRREQDIEILAERGYEAACEALSRSATLTGSQP
jgi:NTE family protein